MNIENIIEKYQEEIVDKFKKCCEKEDIEVVNLDVVGLFDELLCKVNEEKFLIDLIDDIRDSVGVESYGLKEQKDF